MEAISDLKIIVTGECDIPEFHSIVAQLKPQMVHVSPADVVNALESDVDVLAIFVDRPAALDSELVAKWIATAPLLPVVSVLSSHCEGQGRSGTPWPGVINIYWHKWEFQFGRFLIQRELGGLPDWNQPKTSSLVDHRLRSSGIGEESLDLLVAISASSKLDFEMYAEDLACNCHWIESHESMGAPDVVVIDESSLTDRAVDRVERLCFDYPATPKLLALGFPRYYEVQLAKRLGIDRVISKPLDAGELRWSVRKLAKLVTDSS